MLVFQRTSRAIGRSHARCISKDSSSFRPLTRQDSEMLVMNETNPGVHELVDMLQKEQLEAAETQVPWFLENMPKQYFRQMSPDMRNNHLSAIVALHDFDAIPNISLHGENGKSLTMISEGGNSPQKLVDQLSKLKSTQALTGLSLFSSLDNTLSVNVFRFDHETSISKATLSKELKVYIKDLMNGKYKNDHMHAKSHPIFEEAALQAFVQENCESNYVIASSPRRFCKQIELYHEIMKRGTDEVGIDIEKNWTNDPNKMMVTLAITNVLTNPALKRITSYCATKNLNIERTHLDLVNGPGDVDPSDLLRSNTVSIFRILVSANGGTDMTKLESELQADLPMVAKWLDERSLDLAGQYSLPSQQAELVIALCDLCHAVLAPKDPFEFARANVHSIVTNESRFGYTRQIVDLFLKRFDPHAKHPEQVDAIFQEELAAIKQQVDQSGELPTSQQVFHTMLDAVSATLRTNAFVPNRFGMSFRLEPSMCVRHLLDGKQRTEIPYGIYFVHGRRFAGFQLRFRDISRGGLRVVTPRSKEIHSVESSRQLQECYDLAFAQQLKNKDIAESGSKAVALIDTEGIDQRKDLDHVIRKSLKSMVNSVLDIISPKESKYIVDYLKKPEFIYFGPDEQVAPEHIEWMIKRAKEREYPLARAFMSSKSGAGFNHKVYGVTSEGVAVFLDEALDATGVNTKSPFTVKITGGSSGDVASNMMKILHREYGENARIVGLADGTCSLEDPNGLDWSELLHLVHESLDLSSFDTSKFSATTKMYLCDTPEGINKRNTMHNRVIADAFVPGGGRPATINDMNWKNFLTKDGKPSSPLIVEGANLFLTAGAREKLHEKGCVIVKDSSANKCGVICSSFEIIASMLLEEDEFVAIKDELVVDVLKELRVKAKVEADLMFREYKLNPAFPLPLVSGKISNAINRSTDAVAAYLEKMDDDQLNQLMPIIKASLPKKLMDTAFDRWSTHVPRPYTIMQLSCIIASEIVYREGIDYAMSLPEEALPAILLKYVSKTSEMQTIASKVENGSKLSDLEQKLLSSVLRLGGARTIIDHHLD